MGRKQRLRKSSRKATASETATTAADDLLEQQDKRYALDEEFPKSDLFEEGEQRDRNGTITNLESLKLCEQAAIEFACVHSMIHLARFNNRIPSGKYIPRAQPWYLEAAIRGNFFGMSMLVQSYTKISIISGSALVEYWNKRINKMREIKLRLNTTKETILRACIVCKQRDTETITLQQCMGCSMYCYCSEICQINQWEEHNHSGECRQLKILNKYHKPYVKEIRNASIRGDIEIPALEKLRNKLGLTRPAEDYEELKFGRHEGKPIANPYEYIVARKDGTVWVGSNPRSPLGQPSSDITSRTAATTSIVGKGEDVGNMMKPLFGTIQDNYNTTLSSADAFRNSKVKILFERFDKDKDGFLNYDELPALQKATGDDDDASSLSKKSYTKVCQSLNCHPDTGVSVGGLKVSYSSEDGDIDVDYDKVFHFNKTTVSVEDDQPPATTAGPCFGYSASSRGVLVSDFAAHKLSFSTTSNTSRPQGVSLPFDFGGSSFGNSASIGSLLVDHDHRKPSSSFDTTAAESLLEENDQQ